MATNKCLKEWNATIEALGNKKQTLLIRSYRTSLNGFLLFPTFSYATKENYLDAFQPEYHSFVENHAFPEKIDSKTIIKYYAAVEKIVEKSKLEIGSLQSNYIWTSKHVKNYLKDKKAQIWILRIYRLKKPYVSNPTPGAITFANLKEEVSLHGMEPVLTDREFSRVLDYL